MPDLIGLGFSDRPSSAEEHTLENHVRWMAGLLERLDVRDAVAVVQDWGGPTGVGAFSKHPDRLAGLVVLNTTIGPPKPGFRPTAFHRLFGGPLGGILCKGLGYPQRNLGFAQGDKSSISGIVQKTYSYPLKPYRHNDAPLALVRMVPDDMDHPSVAPLSEIGEFAGSFTGPVAMVWGDKDPVLGKLRRRVARQLGTTNVTVTEAGHFLQEEVPEEIADAIRDVIARAAV
jgi:haloalkane dehalogenase